MPDPYSGNPPQSAVRGSDAVLSELGARSAAEAGIASRGTSAIVQAMQATDVRRIIVVSAASVGTVPSPGRPKPPRRPGALEPPRRCTRCQAPAETVATEGT